MNLQKRDVNGQELKIGDVVEFKIDVKQCGKIIGFRESPHTGTKKAVLEGNFIGDYIGGNTKTEIQCKDVYKI